MSFTSPMRRRTMRTSAFGIAAVLVASGLGVVAGAAPALASDGVVEDYVLYGHTGTGKNPAEATIKPPAGATHAYVKVAGGDGGWSPGRDAGWGYGSGGHAGKALEVAHTFANVTQLYLTAARGGTNAGEDNGRYGEGGLGFCGVGGNGETGSKAGRAGGGGGGASAVSDRPKATALQGNIVIAGGGGGGGGVGGFHKWTPVGGIGANSGQSAPNAATFKIHNTTIVGAQGGKNAGFNRGSVSAWAQKVQCGYATSGRNAASDSWTGGGGGAGSGAGIGANGGQAGIRGSVVTDEGKTLSGGLAGAGGAGGSSMIGSGGEGFAAAGIAKSLAVGEGYVSVDWQWPTTTTISATPSKVYSGRSFPLTAAVSVAQRSNTTPAAGTITVRSQSASGPVLATTTTTGSAKTVNVSALSSGTHTLHVQYSSSDVHRLSSSTTISVNVIDVPKTTTSLTLSQATATVDTATKHTVTAKAVEQGTTTVIAGAPVSIYRMLGTSPAPATDTLVQRANGSVTADVPNSAVGTRTYYAVTTASPTSSTNLTGSGEWQGSSSGTSQIVINKQGTELLVEPATWSPKVGATTNIVVRVPAGITPSSAAKITMTSPGQTAVPKIVETRNNQTNCCVTFPVSNTTAGNVTYTFTFTDTNVVAQPATATLAWQKLASTVSLSSINTVDSATTIPLTANVAIDGAPATSGTVAFKLNDNAAINVTVAAGKATATLPMQAAGQHTVTATYTSNANVTTDVDSKTFTVRAVESSTTLATSANTVDFGTPVTLTATVAAGARTPTGTVSFQQADGRVLGTRTLANKKASLTLNSAAGGGHSVKAVYNGDASVMGSSSTTTDFAVTAASTKISLSSLPDEIMAGEVVPFTATVCAVNTALAAPTGTVALVVNGAPSTVILEPSSTDAHCAVFSGTFFAPSVGGITVDATFTGDGDYGDATTVGSGETGGGDGGPGGGTGGGQEVIVGKNSSVTSVSAPVSVLFGAPATATVSVVGGAVSLTGRAEVFAGKTKLDTIDITEGTGTFALPAQAPGTYVYSARFLGNDDAEPSTSADASVEVLKHNATIALTASTPVQSAGLAVVLTASIATGTDTDGTVTFYNGATEIGSKSVTAEGVATLSVLSLPVGDHSITASYSGGTNVNASARSAAVKVTIGKALSNTTLAATSTAAAGKPVSAVVSVFANGTAPDGQVDIFEIVDGVRTLVTTVGLEASVATLTLPAKNPGTYRYIAVYNGETTVQASESTELVLIIGKTTPKVTVKAPAQVVPSGRDVVLTATVVGETAATGSVEFFDAGQSLGVVALDESGSAQFTTSTLASGEHPITVKYSGDDNLTAAETDAAYRITIGKTASTTSIEVPATARYGAETIALVKVITTDQTAGGTVTIMNGTVELGTATLVNGTALYTLPTFEPGSHELTAVYSGSETVTESTSPAATLSVTKQTSTVELQTSAAEPTFGSSVTMTAVITSAQIATGTVEFFDNGKSLGTVNTARDGSASLTTTALTLGAHSITASYSGDDHVMPANAALTGSITVGKAPVTIAMARNASAPFPGATINITANVCANVLTAGAPSGSVKFFVAGKAYWGSKKSTKGACTTYGMAYSSPKMGLVTMESSFTGSGPYGANTADLAPLAIQPWRTRISVSRTATTTPVGGPAALVVSVRSVGEVAVSAKRNAPQGTVTLRIDGKRTTIKAKLVDGLATLRMPTTTAGKRKVDVIYTPASTNWLPVTSRTSYVSVTKTKTINSVTVPALTAGKKATITAKVCSALVGAGAPTGPATFTIGGKKTIVKTGKISGVCRTYSMIYTAPKKGSTTIRADFATTAKHLASTGTKKVTVK